MADDDRIPDRDVRLTAITEGILGDRGLAHDWMRTPSRSRGGVTRAAHAQAEAGAREVEDLLGRLAHGVVV